MDLKIVFYRSQSSKYDTVCSKCKTFSNFQQHNGTNILVVDFFELSEKYKNIDYIVDSVSNWKRTEFYFENFQISSQQAFSLLKIIDCQNKAETNPDQCCGGCGLGCCQLTSLFLKDICYYTDSPYWFDFGYFEKGKWIIDKSKMLQTIEDEATEKYLSVCKFFSYEKIYNSILNVPNEIIVTDEKDCNWRYIFEKPIIGMPESKVIGIEPKERKLYNSMLMLEMSEIWSNNVVSDLYAKNEFEKDLIKAFRKCTAHEKMEFLNLANKINNKNKL